MRARDHATFDVTRVSGGNITMPDCNRTVTDDIHVLLEGPAILAPLSVMRDGNTARVTVTAYDEGIYNVHVEVVLHCQGERLGGDFRRVAEQPLQLKVSSAGAGSKRSGGFPRKPCKDGRWRHGRWMECHATPLKNCMRTGWVWVPHDCYIPTLTPDAIINQAPPTWIVFAGTSVERGSFWSLLDHVLGPRAANLTDSDFWRCWGWLDLTIGNLRISYLDFRIFHMNNRATYMPMYLEQAIAAVNAIGREQQAGPDLFHLEVRDTSSIVLHEGQTIHLLDLVHAIKAWLGPRWTGRFLVSSWKMVTTSAARYEKPQIYDWLEQNNNNNNDAMDRLGIDYIDETNMAAAALHDTEYDITQRVWSMHYHRPCRENGMHLCSVVCDAAAQQILNIAYINREARRETPVRPTTAPQQVAAAAASPAPLRFCLNCPSSFPPIRIADWLQDKDTTCHDYLPLSRRGDV